MITAQLTFPLHAFQQPGEQRVAGISISSQRHASSCLHAARSGIHMIIQLTDGFQHSFARIGSNANAGRIIQHRRDYTAGHARPFGYIEAGYSFLLILISTSREV